MDGWDPMSDHHGEDSNMYHHHPGRITQRRDNASKPAAVGQLFVNGIPNAVSVGALQSLFSEAGNVLEVKKLPCPRPDLTTTYGFVTYATVMEAEKAIQRLNGRQLGPSKLKVQISLSEEERQNRRMQKEKKKRKVGARVIVTKEKDQMTRCFINNQQTNSNNKHTTRQTTQTSTEPMSLSRGRGAFRPIQPGDDRHKSNAPIAVCVPTGGGGDTGYVAAAIHGRPSSGGVCRYADEVRRGLQLTEYRERDFSFSLDATQVVTLVNNLTVRRSIDADADRRVSVEVDKIQLSIERDKEIVDHATGAATAPCQTRRPYLLENPTSLSNRAYTPSGHDYHQRQTHPRSHGNYSNTYELPNFNDSGARSTLSPAHSTTSCTSSQKLVSQQPQQTVSLMDTSDLMTFDDTADDLESHGSSNPDDRTTPKITTYVCASCGIIKAKMKQCKRCKTPYCSKVCQEKDWSHHQHNCQQLAKTNQELEEIESRFEISIGDDLIDEVKRSLDIVCEDATNASNPVNKRRDSGIESPPTGSPKVPEMATLTIGQATRVLVTHAVDPSEVWVQVIDNDDAAQLYHLMERMKTLYESDSHALVSPPKVGDFVAARYSEDHDWYRATIEKVTGSEVTVRFVDYGNTDVITTAVAATSLRQLPDDAWRLRLLGVRCSMAGSSGVASSEDAVLLREMTSSSEFYLAEAERKVDDRDGGGYIVKLMSSAGDECINDKLSASRVTESQASCQNVPHSDANDLPVSPVPDYIQPTLKPNEKRKVLVKHVVSPREVWVQLYQPDDVQKAVTQHEEMNQIYKADMQSMVKMPVKGHMYAAQLQRDHRWYRCVVLAVLNDKNLVVRYVDVGCKDMVARADLRALRSDMKLLPRQAICCGLAGVNLPSGQVDWTENDTKLVKGSLTTNTVLYNMTYKYTEDEIPWVIFSTPDARNINDELVARGCGQSVQSDPRARPSDHQEPIKVNRPTAAKERIKAADVPRIRDDLTVGQTVNVTIIEMKSPCDFMARITLSEAQAIEQEEFFAAMNDHYNNKVPVPYSPIIDELVVAKFSGDSKWYRGKTLSISDSTATVEYIDYGNYEDVNVLQIRKVGPKCRLMPCVASRCRLEGPAQNATLHSLSEEAIRILYDSMNSSVPAKSIVTRVDGDVVVVDLILTNGQLLSQTMKDGESDADGSNASNSAERHDECKDDDDVDGEVLRDENEALDPSRTSEVLNKTVAQSRLPECRNEARNTSPCLPAVQNDSRATPRLPLLQNETVVTARLPDVKYQQIPTHSRVAVTLEVSESGILYAKLASMEDEFIEMMVRLNEHYNDASNHRKCTSPQVNDIVATKFTDNYWYRGKITENRPPSELTVHYLDYGNVKRVSISDVQLLDEQFYEFPIQGVPCRLAGVPESKFPEVGGKLKAFVDDVASLSVVKKISPRFYEVNLYSNDDRLLNEILMRSSPIIRDVKPTSSAEFTRTTLGEVTLNVADESSVVITYVKGPQMFYCQLYEADTLKKMAVMISDIGDHWSSDTSVTHYKPTVGEICCALSLEDDTWYRAEVISVTSPTQILIHYIDFGFEESVAESNLRPLLTKFSLLPALAICCSLSGLPASREWSEKAVSAMQAFQENGVYGVTVESKKGRVHAVRLVDSEGGGDVGEQFVQQGYTVPRTEQTADVSKDDASTATEELKAQLAELERQRLAVLERLTGNH